MSGQIVRQEYELTCIAPVHVGSGQKLKSFEYLYDRRKDEVAFLNESKWIALLAQHDLMDAFANAVMSGAFLRQSIREWLLDHQIKEGELRSIILRRAASAPLITKERGRTKLNDIVAQTTLADGRPYIPGSTIKGTLRTGMLYHAIHRDPARFRSTWQEILRSLREPLKDQKKTCDLMMSRVEQTLLHTLCLSDDVKKGDAVSSAMRGLRVSDAVGTVRDTVVLQKVDATTKKKRQGANVSELPLFRECIPAGAKLRFAVTADLSMLETAGIRSLIRQTGCTCRKKFSAGNTPPSSLRRRTPTRSSAGGRAFSVRRWSMRLRAAMRRHARSFPPISMRHFRREIGGQGNVNLHIGTRNWIARFRRAR